MHLSKLAAICRGRPKIQFNGAPPAAQYDANAAQDAMYNAAFAALTPSSTKYVDPVSGNNGNNGNSTGTAYQTIAYALTQVSASAMIIVIGNGVTINVGATGWINETGGFTPPSGTSWAAPTVIRAQTPFGITLSQASANYYGNPIRLITATNVWIDGFCIDESGVPSSVVELTQHNTLTRCFIRNRVTDEYQHTINFERYCVVEDVAVYGSGRYFINGSGGGGDETIGDSCVRRAVTYMPFSRSTQPKASFAFYGSNTGSWVDCKNVLFANCYDIDAPSIYVDDTATRWGAFYFPKSVRNMQVFGCGLVNVAATYGGVRSDNYGGPTPTLYTASDSFVVNLSSSTYTPEAFSASDGNGNNFAQHCTTHSIPGAAFANNVNQLQCRTSGITYPTRRVSGTGCNQTYQIGSLRSRYGEGDYNLPSTRRLWPYPYEDKIKTFFDTQLTIPNGYVGVASSTNPFTSQSFTSRVWTSAGNSLPNFESIYSTQEADFYVDAAMANDSGDGLTPATAKKYISSGMALLTGKIGKILQIQNGTYSHANDAVSTNAGSGSRNTYNVVRAQTRGSVIITQPMTLPVTTTYITFDGLKFDSADQLWVEGTYLRFLNCIKKGGPSSGNNAKVIVGSNNNGADATHHVLFEDCLIYGSGGRYSLVAYMAANITLRRVVVRVDGGWSDGAGTDPEAGLVFYNTNNSSMQNCIVLDAAGATLHDWQGAFYCIYNSGSAGTNANNSFRGCIALNNKNASFPDGASLRFDIAGSGSVTGAVVTDFVGVDSYWGINVSYQGSIDVDINRFTLLQTTRAAGWGIGGSSTGTKTIKNGIIKGFDTDDVADVSVTYVDTYNNGGTVAGTGVVTYDPQLNGLDQIDKITASTNLKSAGNGDQMGAEVQKQWGRSGSLYNESAWDSLTAESLWPFPNQTLFKTCLQENGITRGLAGSASTLTEYIQNYI
jgi:hypothetical protein